MYRIDFFLIYIYVFLSLLVLLHSCDGSKYDRLYYFYQMSDFKILRLVIEWLGWVVSIHILLSLHIDSSNNIHFIDHQYFLKIIINFILKFI